jgi:hypothetical protein
MRPWGNFMVCLLMKLLIRFQNPPGNAAPVVAVSVTLSQLCMRYRHHISAQRSGKERSSYPNLLVVCTPLIARIAAPNGKIVTFSIRQNF